MLKNYILRLKEIFRLIAEIRNDVKIIKEPMINDIKDPRVLIGNLFSKFNNQLQIVNSLHELEFQVFSQWGDDGIIQYLINNIEIENKIFVEFGVENYRESNTRFLLINDNWSGLVIDGSKDNIEYIKRDTLSWGYDLHAVCEFITKENINGIIKNFLNKGYNRNIGILSIDIDGNDYHIWDEIDVVNPTILIIEYNSIFGYENKWSIPYDSDFMRVKKHHTFQYWGASLSALNDLGNSKGYSFIGCNSNGNNAYFIKTEKLNDKVKAVPIEKGFVLSRFREDLINNERANIFERLGFLKGMPILNTQTKLVETI